MYSWKKLTLLYPLSAAVMATFYTMETLDVGRTAPSADSLSFIVFVLMGVPLCVLCGLILTIIGAWFKRWDVVKSIVAITLSVVLGVISGVFLTAALMRFLG